MKQQESQNQAWAGGRAPRVDKSGQAENRSQAGLQSGARGREQAAKVLLRTDSWRQKPSQSAERQWELGMGVIWKLLEPEAGHKKLRVSTNPSLCVLNSKLSKPSTESVSCCTEKKLLP